MSVMEERKDVEATKDTEMSISWLNQFSIARTFYRSPACFIPEIIRSIIPTSADKTEQYPCADFHSNSE